MGFEQTWRWFGPNDGVTLKEIKQTGATGIVTALHQIPIGQVWNKTDIKKRKSLIEHQGFNWSVVESVPVHDDIKKRTANYLKYIDNYKKTLINLSESGVNTVCYNFMPVLDWSRTDLKVTDTDGSITSRFQTHVFAVFDLFILKRPQAERDYSAGQIEKAQNLFKKYKSSQKDELVKTILLGFPGSLEAYTLEKFKEALNSYKEIDENRLKDNLFFFIREIMPVAEEYGIRMAIHPDDPPWPLLGLPRIVNTKENIHGILEAVNSAQNGLTFCCGSLGASLKNDVIDIAGRFAEKIHFVHLRNLSRNADGDFMEAHHLDGDLDMYTIMKILIQEQDRRKKSGRADFRMPMRPDHGHLTNSDMHKKFYPGYSLVGRMRGLAELRGLEAGIRNALIN